MLIFYSWDILTDEGLKRGLDLCDKLDHGHIVPPCRTYTRPHKAGISDEHGRVTVLRSDKYPRETQAGETQTEAEEANQDC